MEYHTTKYFSAMSSDMSIELIGSDEELVQSGIDKAVAEIKRCEDRWSVFLEESIIKKINDNSGSWISVDAQTLDILDTAYAYTLQTGSVYSILSGTYTLLWKELARQNKKPSGEEIQRLRNIFLKSEIFFDRIKSKVKISTGSKIDLGGCAKGYIGDYIKGMLMQIEGIRSVCLNLGGHVTVTGRNQKYYKVGIQNPRGNGVIPLVFHILDESVVTSGDYQRYIKVNGVRYHHIINTLTGSPAKSDICSVSIINSDGVLCEVLSTYCFILGLESIALCEDNRIAAVFITCDLKLYLTSAAEKMLY